MRRVFPLALSRALFALWIVLGTAESSLLRLGPMGAAATEAMDAGMPGMPMPGSTTTPADGAERSDLATRDRSGDNQGKRHQHGHCIDCCMSCSASALHSAPVAANALLPVLGNAKPRNSSGRAKHSSPLQLLPPGTGPPPVELVAATPHF
jgi:hypothetical protein